MFSTPKKLVSKMRRATASLSSREETAGLGDAGVVDHQGHVGGHLCRQGNLLGLGDIEPQGLDTRQGDGGGVACGGVDLAGTARQQFARKCQADAAVGAGDEDDRVFNVHGRLQEVDSGGK
jgi:hypothetical protein